MGGGQGNMVGGVAQQLGGAQIPAPPDRGQAMGAGQMRIPQMQQMQPQPMQPSTGGGGKSGTMPASNGMGQFAQASQGQPWQSFGMGRFGQFPMAYQPPAYQPAIFQPPPLAPVNTQLQMPGLLSGYVPPQSGTFDT